MPSQFVDRQKSNLTMQLGAIAKQVHEQQPQNAEMFEKRLNTDIIGPATMLLEKLEAIRTSGRFSQDGERKERRLAVHAFTQEKLLAVRAATVGKLETRLQEQRAALLKARTATVEPTLVVYKELRARELRDHLKTLDPLELQTRIRLTEDTELLDALDGAPSGFPIAPPELVAEARTRIAEANHPELGELASLQKAYEFALGVVENTILAASGLSKLEVVHAREVEEVAK